MKRAELKAEIQQKQAELTAMEEAERSKVNELHKVISDLSEETGLFVGAILTAEDIAGIIKTAIESHEPIKIPFNVYSIET